MEVGPQDKVHFAQASRFASRDGTGKMDVAFVFELQLQLKRSSRDQLIRAQQSDALPGDVAHDDSHGTSIGGSILHLDRAAEPDWNSWPLATFIIGWTIPKFGVARDVGNVCPIPRNGGSVALLGLTGEIFYSSICEAQPPDTSGSR